MLEPGFSEILAEVRREHHELVDTFLDRHGDDIDRLAGRCADTVRGRGKILLFGNGGSASDAQHLAAELVNRFDRERPALAAVALASDGAVLTSIANDADFRQVFSRQIEALGHRGDLAIGISTSGRSPNVVHGLLTARRLGLRTAALLGREGGSAASATDLALVVPGDRTARIQEVHILAIHLLCRRLEDLLEAGNLRQLPATSEGW